MPETISIKGIYKLQIKSFKKYFEKNINSIFPQFRRF